MQINVLLLSLSAIPPGLKYTNKYLSIFGYLILGHSTIVSVECRKISIISSAMISLQTAFFARLFFEGAFSVPWGLLLEPIGIFAFQNGFSLTIQ